MLMVAVHNPAAVKINIFQPNHTMGHFFAQTSIDKFQTLQRKLKAALLLLRLFSAAAGSLENSLMTEAG